MNQLFTANAINRATDMVSPPIVCNNHKKHKHVTPSCPCSSGCLYM